MSVKYVRKTGSDSNNGNSPATAYLTIAKLIGASGVLVAGDIAYVGAGVYREAVTVGITSPASEIQIIADVSGAQTGDAGEVRWTAYTTNDTTAPTTSPLILAGRDNLTFKKFVLQAGTGNAVDASTSVSTGIKLEDCTFVQGSANTTLVNVQAAVDTALNWTIDRCRFLGWGLGIGMVATLPTSASADYNVNVTVQNCVFTGVANGYRHNSSGANSFKGGGALLMNCTIHGTGSTVLANTTNLSTTYPITITNCFVTGNATLTAQTSGQIVEDYNLIIGVSPRTNVSTGTHSSSDGSKSPLFHIGQQFITNGTLRPFLLPTTDSPILGLGTSTGAPAVDILGQTRPNPPSIGAYEAYTPSSGSSVIVVEGD